MLRLIREYAILTAATVLTAAATYFFMFPLHIAVGSGAALAMILGTVLPVPISVISFTLNVILLIVGFLTVGREFGAKTVYASIVLPLSLGVFELLFPDFRSLTEDPLLDMMCYILLSGIGTAILFSRNASSGGLDIVAKIMNQYLRMDIGRAMGIAGMVIAFSSILCYDTKTVVLSVLGTYFGGIMVDRFIFGLNIKRRVCVISEKSQPIIDFLLTELHSGATLYESIGAYDNVTRREIVTIVNKQEYRRLMDYIKAVDPRAFVTVISVNEAQYQPKNPNESKKRTKKDGA